MWWRVSSGQLPMHERLRPASNLDGVVGHQSMAADDEVESALALADAAFADDEDAKAEHVHQDAVDDAAGREIRVEDRRQPRHRFRSCGPGSEQSKTAGPAVVLLTTCSRHARGLPNRRVWLDHHGCGVRETTLDVCVQPHDEAGASSGWITPQASGQPGAGRPKHLRERATRPQEGQQSDGSIGSTSNGPPNQGDPLNGSDAARKPVGGKSGVVEHVKPDLVMQGCRHPTGTTLPKYVVPVDVSWTALGPLNPRGE